MSAIEVLADDLTRLPTQALSAVRVLRAVEDPRASSADLAKLIEMDPVLSARVLRLANAPYYGLTRRVPSAARAVVLLGFSTVRALAVSAAVGLLEVDRSPVPDGFWLHAVSTGAAASVLARRLDMSTSEAFSAGLLHDVGTTLLYGRGSEGYRAAFSRRGQLPGLLSVELDEFGMTHAKAGARVFELWRFPPRLVRAVAAHHDPIETVQDGLGRLIVAGEALALTVEPGSSPEPATSVEAALDALGLDVRPAAALADVRREIADLAHFLELG